LSGFQARLGSNKPLAMPRSLLSRIIAIVDAYKVMITRRPYKKAVSKKEATTELKKCSDTQFDPLLVEKFVKILISNKRY